jgi:hypothetical protein
MPHGPAGQPVQFCGRLGGLDDHRTFFPRAWYRQVGERHAGRQREGDARVLCARPAPFGPSSATISPCATEKLTSGTARTAP